MPRAASQLQVACCLDWKHRGRAKLRSLLLLLVPGGTILCLEAPRRLELRIAAVTWLNICTSTHTQSDNCGKEFTEQRGQYLLLNAI